jgi:SAM-dependent methyltransferase
MTVTATDGYGRLLADAFAGVEHAQEIVERDDGFIAASPLGPQAYLAPYRRWPSRQRRALRLVRGRVLDVGTGAGRVALHLQERGREVVAIDNSPGAVEAAKRRGVRDVRQIPAEKVDAELGAFGTIVLFGNNLGLLGGVARGRRLLRRFRRVTEPRARILGESLDPYATDDPLHLAYHERNRRRGRLGGQLRIRVRYRDVGTPWFDYCLFSPTELEEVLTGTGWNLERALNDDPPLYIAVLTRD